MIAPGETLTLEIEKPTAGGRMLARHRGQVVLVWGAIPGERVDARIERTGKGVVYAETIAVPSSSPDRRAASGDWRCGGNVLQHVEYARQLRLKGEIIQDAFGRIGRIPMSVPDVIGSPEEGYRMRAHLHARNGRLGFYREGSHDLCDAAATRQLLPATIGWIARVEDMIRRERLSDLAGIDIAENVSGEERACHLELRERADPARYGVLADGLVGLSAQCGDAAEARTLAGTPAIHDVIELPPNTASPALRLRRHVRAFFQGNRFLLARLVSEVIARVPAGSVVDLYAGGGLLGLALAASGAARVTLVEGDPVSASDLDVNARPFADRVRVERRSVEGFLARVPAGVAETLLVDPPRTGLSRDAHAGVVRARPTSIVYVSCDVPTLARDARGFLEAGYELSSLVGLDLFPNTAHVETVAVFSRPPA